MSVHARVAWRRGRAVAGEREVAEEVPVALSYNGVSHAVMLATPADLEDFAVGFSLSEGIVDEAAEIEDVVVQPHAHGIVLRLWLPAARQERLRARRRHMAGPAGCGLCGIESLVEAARAPAQVSATARFVPEDIEDAVAALRAHQPLNARTRAVHAAGFWHKRRGMVAAREDVGRHNALDKLGGALARGGLDAREGIVVVSSRVSVELVQKASRLGAGLLAAVSAPTALALDAAEAAGLTLVGVAREDGFEVFTHEGRIEFGSGRSVGNCQGALGFVLT